MRMKSFLRMTGLILAALLTVQIFFPVWEKPVRAFAEEKKEEEEEDTDDDYVDLSGSSKDDEEDIPGIDQDDLQSGTDSLLDLGADKQKREIDDLIAKMTLEEKVGQMIQIAIRGWREYSSENYANFEQMNEEVRKFISERRLGGVILYAENCADSSKTRKLVNDMQAANVDTESSVVVPLLVAVDQEGGIVNRLGHATGWLGSMAATATGDPEYAREEGRGIGKDLVDHYINTDYAPVMDVNDNPANPVIGVRAFSDDMTTVSTYGVAFMEGLSESGTIPVLKHFPGHGNTDSDSHTGLPKVEKTLDEINDKELVPFRRGIEAGADMIMTAHIQYPEIEKETYVSKSTGEKVYIPATMSHVILTEILREKMGFEGVVITDALEMGAIVDHFDEDDVYRMSINAGADILLSPHTIFDRESMEQLGDSIDSIVSMVEKGDISEERIDEAVRRILTLKAKYGLLEAKGIVKTEEELEKEASSDKSDYKERSEKSWEMTRKAITLLKNENDVLPYKAELGQKVLILYPGQSRVNTAEYARERLERENVIPEGTEWETMVYERSNAAACIEAARNADYVIGVSTLFDKGELDPHTEDGESGAVLDEIIEAVHEEKKPITLISAELPYDAARYQGADAILVTYGSTWMLQLPEEGTLFTPNLPAAICAVFGGFTPEGTLPVDLPKLDSEYNYTKDILYTRGFSAAESFGKKSDDQ